MTAANRPAPPAAPPALLPADPGPAAAAVPRPWAAARPGGATAPPAPLWRRLATPAGTLAAVVGAFAYVGAVDPNHPGHYPVCPLYRFTGLYCPGCGGLRSAHAFVHGDLVAALHDNAPAVAGYLLFAVLWVVWAARAWRGRPAQLRLGSAQMWSLGALLLVFTVVRNLPFGAWLHP
ncbi:membrane protein [Streptomyces hygroscopicus subsp. hygroscopicus]|nr:membrane protein [Streptomyces hygroscopicus subsp. hygroscopicus]